MKTNACIKKVWLIINSVPCNVMTDNFGSNNNDLLETFCSKIKFKKLFKRVILLGTVPLYIF